MFLQAVDESTDSIGHQNKDKQMDQTSEGDVSRI